MFSILSRKHHAGDPSRLQNRRQTPREKSHRRKLQKRCPPQVTAQLARLQQDRQESHTHHADTAGTAGTPQKNYGDDTDYLRTYFDNHGDHLEPFRFGATGYYQSPNAEAIQAGNTADDYSNLTNSHVRGRVRTPYPFNGKESQLAGGTSDSDIEMIQHNARGRAPTPYPATGEIVVHIPRNPLGSSTPKRVQSTKGKERSDQAPGGGHWGEGLSDTEVRARQEGQMKNVFQEYRAKLHWAKDCQDEARRDIHKTHARLLDVFASKFEEPHHQPKQTQPHNGLGFFEGAPDGRNCLHVSFAPEPKREDSDQDMDDEDVEHVEDVEMADQPALIPVQSSLYGARNVWQLSSTMFEDAGFTPTSRLGHWLHDVEGHSQRRRVEIAEENKKLDIHPPPAWNFDAYINENRLSQGDQDLEMSDGLQEQHLPLTRAPAPQDVAVPNMGGAKHKLSEDDAEDGPALKRSRRTSIFDAFKRRISSKQGHGNINNTSRRSSLASQRLSSMRQSAMGLIGRATPSFMPQIYQSTPDKTSENFRFAVVRDSMAGKSALVERFTEGTFSNIYKTSSWSSTVGALELDSYRASIEIWDVSASSQISGTNPLGMTYFHALFICYSVEDEKNPAAVAEMWQHTARSYCENVPIFVVGLKKDLRKDAPTLKLRFLDEPNPATRAQGELVAKQIGATAFSEVSAKTGEGVNELFEDAVRNAMSIRKVQDKERAERLRRERVKGAVVEARKRASELLCFQDNI